MRFFLVFVFSLSSSYLFSQESSLSAGNTFTGSNGTISFSFGQITNVNISNSNGSVTTGVQQTFEIIEEPSSVYNYLSKSIVVYPNPTSDFIDLEINQQNLSGLNYQLLDVDGKLILAEKIIQTTNKISFLEKPNGVYFMVVYEDKVKTKSFRIIKNK